ncbi:MAG: fused MFS/spermidine synthase, partial [Propionibacteriaceae bacterium]
SVLVVELVALRLLAPYLGLTLETSTLVIGVALAAIAMGSWAGGRVADVVSPRRALAPLLGVSGVAVAVTPVAIRGTAEVAGAVLLLTASLAIIVPGTLLAAVTPMVTKLRLRNLDHTGTVVGLLSGIGTAGGIFGTVLTGFVLISRVPVSAIMVGLGVLLVAAAAVLELRVRRWRVVGVTALLVLTGGAVSAISPDSCDVETTYHCAAVLSDPARPSGRTLVLDGLNHSYVDLDDPTYLAYDYAKAVVAAIDTAFPTGQPLRAHHIGGGGLTVPRYLERSRPQTESSVSEIDPGVVQIDRTLLRLPPDSSIDVRVEDGRVGLGRLADDSQQLVVGDAFGGVSVPWHLTTREAVTEVGRVLTPDGSYVLNLIDFGPLALARAEVRTLSGVFAHVAVAAETDTLTGGETAGGNLVVVASDRPIDTSALAQRLTDRGVPWGVLSGAQLASWAGDAAVLTDDYAPVDQLLTPYPDR